MRHRSMPRVPLLAAAASLVLAGGLAATGASPADAASITTTYAPLVYLHSSESYLPMSAETFVSRSSLRWSHDGGCNDHELAASGRVSSGSMANGSYTHQTANAICRHSGTTYRSNNKVRPYSLSSDSNEGMFLDMGDSYRKGTGTTSPVYVDYVAKDHLTYWFMYGFSDTPSNAGWGDHEGDWERVSILLNSSNAPTRVAYFTHDGYCTMSWSSAPKSGTHLRVYSAKGSHASYPTSGRHQLKLGGVKVPAWDETNAGKAWNTWNNVLSVRQAWYGYGGGWGSVGTNTHSTGPLGPSAYKGPEPSNWYSPTC